MSAIEEYILFAAGLLFICVVISYAITLKDTGTNIVSNANEVMVAVNTSIGDGKVTKYDGLVVSGADVTNVVRRFPEDGVRVVVQTKNQSVDPDDSKKLVVDDLTNTYVNSKFADLAVNGWKDYTKIPQIGDKDYINPSADFQCSVTTDTSSGYVKVMTFTQQEATNVAKAVINNEVNGGGDGGGNGGNGGNGQYEIGETSLASLNTALATVATSLQTVSTQLTTILNGDGADVTPDQSGSVAKSLADLQSSINQLSTDMKTNDSRIETKVDNLTGTVNMVQSTVEAMQKSLDSLTIAVNNTNASATDVKQLKASLDEMQKSLETLKSSVNSNTTAVKQVKDATLNTNSSSSLISRLNSLDQQMSNMSTTIATLKSKVAVLEQQAGTGG